MLLKAAWVLPVSGPPIRAGAVQIEGPRIAAVGPWAALLRAGEPVVDLGDAILTPGLVNPHTHLELTAYAGQLAPGPFWEWLPKLVARRAAPGQVEREQAGVRDGAWQSVRAGVTCVGDISRRSLHWQVLKSIPMRKVCFVELLTLADHPPRNPAELRAAVGGVEEDALLSVGVSPHTPYTVPAEHIRAALQYADELGRPWCTHWAETREEIAFVRGDEQALPASLQRLLAQCGIRSPRCAPIELLEQCSAGLRPGALAHYNYPAPGDAERLAKAGHVVVYCPRAHRFFGHSPHPYRELMRAGVTVAIGTDSAASNEGLAVLDELRFLRQMPDAPPAATLLAMATVNAARALGLHEQIGTLEPGKQADIAAFPCPPDVSDPAAALIDCTPAPVGVWVAGRRVLPQPEIIHR